MVGLLVEGHTNREIAERNGDSASKTAESYRSRLFQKLGLGPGQDSSVHARLLRGPVRQSLQRRLTPGAGQGHSAAPPPSSFCPSPIRSCRGFPYPFRLARSRKEASPAFAASSFAISLAPHAAFPPGPQQELLTPRRSAAAASTREDEGKERTKHETNGAGAMATPSHDSRMDRHLAHCGGNANSGLGTVTSGEQKRRSPTAASQPPLEAD